jgi:gluconolactonase
MSLGQIPLSDGRRVGTGVRRPECVAVDKQGVVWLTDELSACARVMPDGSLARVGRAGGTPNGIAIDLEDRIVIANFGGPAHGHGPLQRLDPATGNVQTVCAELDGRRLFGCNFAMVDTRGRIWCSHSTWGPVDSAFDGQCDGFVFRVDPDGQVTVVARDIAFANGMAMDYEERNLLVCQTSACDVIRYPILSDGALGAPHRYGPVLGRSHREVQHLRPLTAATRAELGATDGCGFDQDGNLWVTLFMANSVVAITPSGRVVTMLSDPEGRLMRSPTNVSWGGADLRDLYIGSVSTNYVLHFRSPVPGMPLAHQR